MTPWLLALAAIGQAAPSSAAPLIDTHIPLAAWGRDSAHGVLVNHTPNAVAIDPSRPTVVVVHGANPLHPWLHLTIAERYAEVYGGSVQVLGWDWNAVTLRGITPSGWRGNAIEQGHALAGALRGAGLHPARVELVGQSFGCLVATVAARDLAISSGWRVAKLTLLDPPGGQHDLIFNAFGATGAAAVVEHDWAAGPSGLGRPSGVAGVSEQRIDGPARLRGLFNPAHSDHLNAVRWHLGRVERRP